MQVEANLEKQDRAHVCADRKKHKGLSARQVAISREKYGENQLMTYKRKGFLRKFFENMGDPVIKILLGALLVNILFSLRNSSWVETLGIGVSVFLATFISTMSEYTSQRAFESLSRESTDAKAKVLRIIDDKVSKENIPVSEIVVGDIVLLETGDKIYADGVIVSGSIGVDQSSLTGESRELYKVAKGRFRADTSDKSSVFSGSLVLSGNCEMQVCRVGKETFLGGISKEIQSETRESPLKIRLTKLAKQISSLGYVMAFLCAFAYLLYSFVFESAFDMHDIMLKLTDIRFVFSELLHAFTLGLTVIVMAVPEGLPMMIAVVLSSNIRKMVKDNVLVRKPVGIEAAGSMNILFTDKTGTLTEGNMKVCGIITGECEKMSLSELKSKSPYIFDVYKVASKFCESEIVNGKIVGGNLTDRALILSVENESDCDEYKLINRKSFDSADKFSAIRLEGKDSMTIIKGAPEVILPNVKHCINKNGDLAVISEKQLDNELKKAAESGYRIITVAKGRGGINSRNEFGELVLICNILISDTPRKEAKESVRKLCRAGIQVVMITGDNKETATAIAKSCGIINSIKDLCITSKELAKMSDDEVKEILKNLRVVARALPTDKSRLIKIAMESSMVVGMTGDGVNDAPALKSCDVGFAMGSGTEVAKEASDIIILDNNLASIVNAVLYGRTIFKSIRKFIVLQLTINVCAAGITMIGPFIGVKAPVTVTQMLWINIIMDTLGGIAFAGEPPMLSYLKENPKKRNEAILNKYMINQISVLGSFTLLLSVAFLRAPFIVNRFRGGENTIWHLTAFFAFFIFAGIFNCFNARTDSLNLFKGLSKNKAFVFIILSVMIIQIAFVYLGKSVLRTVPLTISELAYTMKLSLMVFPLDLIRKIALRFSAKRLSY